MTDSIFLIIFLICLFIIGVFLFFKTAGYKYIGLLFSLIASIALLYVAFSFFNTPFVDLIRILITFVLFAAVIYFSIVECIIYRDSKATYSAPPDYIIVHGAKVHGITPSPSLRDRLDATLHCLNELPSATAILTGAKWPFAEVSEAQCMYDYLTFRGIDGNRLIIEDLASDTLENLRYSIAEIKRRHPHDHPHIALLTSDYHMHRALYLARAESIQASAIAVRTQKPLVRLNYFIREAFAMTELYLFGAEGL